MLGFLFMRVIKTQKEKYFPLNRCFSMLLSRRPVVNAAHFPDGDFNAQQLKGISVVEIVCYTNFKNIIVFYAIIKKVLLLLSCIPFFQGANKHTWY